MRTEARHVRDLTVEHRYLLLVVAPVVASLWLLRSNLTDALLPNDAAIHASMVRWVARRLADGHLPFDGWYPFLSLGAPRFHHYQSFPHILVGTLTFIVGDDHVFQWSLYMLLATWPISVYVGARWLGCDRAVAGAAALAGPLLVSEPKMGLEWGSYMFRGYGAWAQLCGMWMLPLAWGLTWQAVETGRRRGVAAIVLGLTIVTHLLLAYLALGVLPFWVLLGRNRLVRFRRAVPILIAAACASAWLLVPVVLERAWMVRDVFSLGGAGYDGFGLGAVLDWFAGGNLFDSGRLPTLTLFILVGLGVTIARREEGSSRAILGALTVSLALMSGRETFGRLYDLIPGGEDLFARRFIAGVHLAGLFLAGIGIRETIRWAVSGAEVLFRRTRLALALAAVGVALIPAVADRIAYAGAEVRLVAQQEAAEATQGAGFDALLSYLDPERPGRVYAGLLGGWGKEFRVGGVPVYSGLLNRDIDAVGFLRPTWSLLSGFERLFDDRIEAQYRIFGIRYLLFPETLAPPTSAELVAVSGGVRLLEIPDSGYLRVVQTRGSLRVDRSTLVAEAGPLLTDPVFLGGVAPTMGFAGRPPARPTLSAGQNQATEPGSVVWQDADLDNGSFSGEAALVAPAVVVLSAPFDPGWTASLDGRPAATLMVAPGMVGVGVPAGRHVVAFQWQGFPYYAVTLLGLLAPLALATWDRLRRKR